MRDKRSVFGGIMLLLGAAALLLGRLGYLDGIGFWPIVFTICLAGILIGGLFRKNFTMVLFAIAFWIILNDKMLGLEAITPWPALWAAALGSAGMGMLFGTVGGRKSVLWGSMFLAWAVVVIASRLGYLEGIGFWSVMLTIFCVRILIEGFLQRSFWMILFSIAFLIIFNDGLLGLEAITPWPVLGAALLGSIGLRILFPGYGRHAEILALPWMRISPGCKKYGGEAGKEYSSLVNTSRRDKDKACYESYFGSMVRYISGEIGKADLECSFGSLQVYFTDAQLKDNEAQVNVEVNFGGMVLYIPSSWKTVLNVENAFGNTEERGQCDPEGENVLYIEGEVNFAHLLIWHV